MRNGSQPAAALSAVTGLSLLEVEKRWHASIQELNFGGDYLNRGRGPNGLEVLEEGAQHHPDYGNLQLTLAFEYLNREELANALEHAQQALEDPHLIFRQHAHYVVARASISTDPNAAARALQESIAFQPWNEQIFGDDYELMAFMYDKIDQSSLAIPLRSELETMRRLDRR
jgi:tetratricopeptide (TPR) repeat protein